VEITPDRSPRRWSRPHWSHRHRKNSIRVCDFFSRKRTEGENGPDRHCAANGFPVGRPGVRPYPSYSEAIQMSGIGGSAHHTGEDSILDHSAQPGRRCGRGQPFRALKAWRFGSAMPFPAPFQPLLRPRCGSELLDVERILAELVPSGMSVQEQKKELVSPWHRLRMRHRRGFGWMAR